MQGAVDACGLQVHVVNTIDMVVDIHLCPHRTVIGHFEGQVLGLLDRISAVDYHVALANGHIGEIVLVGVGVLLVTALVKVFLETDDIHLLLLHLRQDILCHETGGLTTEHRHVVGGHLDAWLGIGLLVE